MGSCHGTTATVDIDHQSAMSNVSIRTDGTPADLLQEGNVSFQTRRSFSDRAAAQTQTSTPVTWRSSLQNDCVVDSADIISVLDERVTHVINQFTSAEVLQIQRHVRAITRAVRGMPSAAALMNMGRATTATSLLPNTKTGLSKHCMDEAVLRRIFATGSEQFQRGLGELSKWKKKKNIPLSSNASKNHIITEHTSTPEDSSHVLDNSNLTVSVSGIPNLSTSLEVPLFPSYTVGKYKADPIGSVYLLLLACSETRWECYAAASVAIAAKALVSGDGSRTLSTSASSNLDVKKVKPFVNGMVPFRNGSNDIGSNDDEKNNVPNGISFFMLCYLMAIAAKSSNRDQKLLLLFHILVPPKQLKSALFQQQTPNAFPRFPSYMFEIGFTPKNKEIYLSVASGEIHPSKLPLKVSSAVTIDTIASLLLVSMYVPCGNESTIPVPDYGTEGKDEAIAKLHSLYESCTMDQLWSYDDFLAWAYLSLDDTMIDHVLQTLFSAGIIMSPERELQIVHDRWLHWQKGEYERRCGDILTPLCETLGKTEIENTPKKRSTAMWGLVNGSNPEPTSSFNNSNDASLYNAPNKERRRAWGGVGNFDGLGGLGDGVLYCIDTRWWESWEKYTGWQWGHDSAKINRKPKLKERVRPGALSTESLLKKNTDIVRGVLGSYEMMKSGLQRNLDYVVVPYPVWDFLFEYYGGGPPLPRMVDMRYSENVTSFCDAKKDLVAPIPESLHIVTHPWIIHCQVCDPIQPYRRGDAGSFTIRVMVTPDQPFWRFFAEIVLRLPASHVRARDANGKGKARMWRKVESPRGEDQGDLSGACRYGPWALLCKGRSVEFPVDTENTDLADFHAQYQDKWLKYADHGTIESSGLSDGMEVMFEYSLIGKDGALCWPREAAAKAGRARRLADEDNRFRLMLRGLDEHGSPSDDSIIGTIVDAMDFTGRWYPAEIVEVERNKRKVGLRNGSVAQVDRSESFEVCEDIEKSTGRSGMIEIGRVKVDFGEIIGLEEWIEADSDRLAVAGRFTSDGIKSLESHDDSIAADSKSQNGTARKSGGSSNDASVVENGAVCPFPGYGGCGLVNLGNTCYMSVALQCLSYMPFIRAYLLSCLYKTTGDLNRENPLGTGGKILEELSELMRQMWSGKYGARSPTRFRALLAKTRSQFVGTEQQDAQELLNALIDSLHEDSNRIKSKPMVPPLDDAWVKNSDLERVGLEAWRRFLRRNRSIITDTIMGQVLNRVLCPSCGHSSLNFDPFNMLSIPFPAVTDIVFRCTLVRRGTALNCPALFRSKNSNHSLKTTKSGSTRNEAIIEVYTINMPRLADVGDLKHRLEQRSGVAADRMRLWKAEKADVSHRVGRKIPIGASFVNILAISNKEGPCVQLIKQPEKEDATSTVMHDIYSFEDTLNVRAIPTSQESESNQSGELGSGDDDTVASEDGVQLQMSYRQRIQDDLLYYGDNLECFMVDTDPAFIARAVSRSLWPKNGSDFKLGLRVDAIDQRGHWFPGSVVEISDTNGDGEVSTKHIELSRKVRLHFDNFSSKWDEWYDFNDFCNGQVTPLYSHSTPRLKPTEVIVYHRLGSTAKKVSNFASGDLDATLFGQAFCIQFFNEWSTARAGAHILAQAARFLRSSKLAASPSSTARKLSKSDSTPSNDRLNDASDLASVAITDAINVLVESELYYIKRALSQGDADSNDDFDAAAMTSSLSEKLGSVLPRLPFDVRVCSVDSLLGKASGGEIEETSFPFSLVRTVGNYLNTRSAIVLHWRNVRSDKTGKKKSPRSLDVSVDCNDDALVAYMNPDTIMHPDESVRLKPEQSVDDAGEKSKSTLTMDIGVCLTEFCREQKLPLEDGWYCPKCKDFREGLQSMSLWLLPDILTLHVKRFNCSARWREKISTKINFPLTGLDMSQWCDKESSAYGNAGGDSTYDLIGVVNHLGGMTGGHYVAACKATPCSVDGSEELAHNFNGAGSNGFAVISPESMLDDQSVWRLPGLGKDKEGSTVIQQSRVAASACSRAVSQSSEPLWLHFDDDLVEPIPPKAVVSEMAYVLFYRRRELTPSNMARYSTLD